ncbi:conserved protein of unknown function [Tenacibaculum sp. 190524A02b]|uniref:hypothetical protein n=1 Tax=Tenacibaculum vairaonense TaxID=3137860 RepID=UPI0032B2F07E
MQITQIENGNILVLNDQGEIELVGSNLYFLKHPRIDNVILISDSINTNEEIALNVPTIDLYIGKDKINGNSTFALKAIAKEFQLSGAKQVEPADPMRLLFDKMDTYEKMLQFVKEYVFNSVPDLTKDSQGRLVREYYYCQFDDFQVQITLYYYYEASNPNRIDRILMSGNTENIALPIKQYTYDSNGNVSYSYVKVVASN